MSTPLTKLLSTQRGFQSAVFFCLSEETEKYRSKAVSWVMLLSGTPLILRFCDDNAHGYIIYAAFF